MPCCCIINTSSLSALREVELIHGRWAMLGVLALVVSDMAGHPFYPPGDAPADVVLPLVLIGAIILALLETYRLAALWDEKDSDARMYPGGCLAHSCAG